jgi:F-type H+-transporting ATPase subunit gamma
MAKGTKELKRRIRGVGNIKQITRAMEMVATTKLKRLQGRAAASRPYSDKIQEMVGRLSGMPGMESASPLMEPREVKNAAVIMITSDKGLCGAYNTNIIRKTVGYMAENEGPGYTMHLFGRKGFLYLKRRPYNIAYRFEGTLEKITYADVKEISRNLQDAFLQGEIDEARIFYTSFVSTMTQRPMEQKILPITRESLLSGEEGGQAGQADFLLEPSPQAIFQALLPKFLEVKIYSALMESLASEYAARRVAMKAATDASEDMIRSLTKQYNRARQESITKELLEIVGGAEALLH